ncbi:response regulator transcription factor [Streptococcus oricebi]|uniref:DNA-binding response regulator n=1 Tax=Streptococcus oricebi TaxID=1547447 RepID=A0ABS5B2L1_9STRE|nr:response regulator transcription factor [Streptococcus oricebi]MBP2623069.1 DNA-binding response regulator [Streptococcus oricebi]
MARILIIEDNSDIQEILLDHLGGEHDITPAYSGTEGLSLFATREFDLILLDIMLPGKTGNEVLSDIRKSHQIPIIIMTALSDKGLVSQYLLAGANDYLVKPFNLEEVHARIAVQLRQLEPATDNLRYGKLSLDRNLFEIRNGEARARLSKKEFLILEKLIAHPQKIYTKEELYEQVWGEIYMAGDNTLNTHLSKLRKKLAKIDDSQDYIETVWGLGIRLKGDKS